MDDVLNEGVFDATSAQALRWLTRRHRTMVARSRCYRKTASLGSTVVGQQEYALPTGLISIDEVTVAGVTYGPGWHRDISSDAQGLLWLCGTGGVYTPEESVSGAAALTLIPAPTTAGDDVSIRGVFLPPADLSVSDDATILIPAQYDDGLVAGAMATALMRGPGDFRQDLAQGFEQAFVDTCEELRRDVSRRYRGAGGARIRVLGINA